MKYIQPFTYFLRKPSTGWKNVGIGCICAFVPIAGQLVWFGYRAEVNDDLDHDPAMARYSDFNADRLMPYLQRGIGPGVTNLLVSIAFILPLYVGVFIGGMLAGMAAIDPFLVMGLTACVCYLVVMVMMAIVWPMEIHAMKTRKLQLVAEFKFAIGFLRVVGLETFVTIFLFNMLGQVLLLLGMLFFCVGVYPAAVIYTMAEQHLMLQLYQRYIEEGGQPVDTWSELEQENDGVQRPKARRVEPEIE